MRIRDAQCFTDQKIRFRAFCSVVLCR